MAKNRREFLKVAGAGSVALAMSGCTSTVRGVTGNGQSGSASRPNIIFILADDLGYGDLGCYGSEDIKTPNIDMMAKKGVLFTDFYVNAPVCSPARAGFLTGRAHERCGVSRVITPGSENGLPLNETTIADALRAGGYATGILGKWHLGYTDAYNPVNRGFDRFIGHLSGNLDHHSRVNPRLGVDWMDGLEKIEEKGYTTDLIGKHSIEFVKANKDRPFFLFVSHQAPHGPFQGPDDGPLMTWEDGAVVMPPQDTRPNDVQAAERYSKYIKMVERMDKVTGDLLNTLKDEGLAENTLVMFVSDNGPSWLAGTTGGLRGGKHSLTEGGIRVPAVAYWAGRIKPGVVTDEPATILDLFPTFLNLAGLKPETDVELDGIDIGAVLIDGGELPERVLCWRYMNQAAVRRGKWKMIGGHDPNDNDAVSFKELHDLEKNREEDEEKNLYEEHPEIVGELKAAYEKWWQEVANDAKRRARK